MQKGKPSSLPNRQLRNIGVEVKKERPTSLPNRQLRNARRFAVPVQHSSLPNRQIKTPKKTDRTFSRNKIKDAKATRLMSEK